MDDENPVTARIVACATLACAALLAWIAVDTLRGTLAPAGADVDRAAGD